MKHYLGLGKTLYNSSVCLLTVEHNNIKVENILNERVTRSKASGKWPKKPLSMLIDKIELSKTVIAECRDVNTPRYMEDILDDSIPFYDYLKKKNLHHFSTKFNSNIEVIPHHITHAYSALALSPFNKSLIVVIDGAGSKYKDFEHLWNKSFKPKKPDSHEECSIFIQNRHQLTEVKKYWQKFNPSINASGHCFSEGIGTLYEKSAEFIFNSTQACGKVMGLAAFGTKTKIDSYHAYLESLNWKKSFKGKSKSEWEASPNIKLYQNIAATVQDEFENRLFNIIRNLKNEYPETDNLILVGGCALNCSFNSKLLSSKIFSNIYVPPFPGDSGIGFGIAHYLLYKQHPELWKRKDHHEQHGYFGPFKSIPNEFHILDSFKDFKITRPKNILEYTSERLEAGDIIAWYQGRSESGPRALGNRSIIASIRRDNLKQHLNQHIKFRETFRPYGCSCTNEWAPQYFDLPVNFNNPYMSFAVNVRNEYINLLKEVTHIDGTSRMQIVTPGQNKKFYDLIRTHGARTGDYCIANSSLNIMGEPIVESIEDAVNFLKQSNVDALVIGDYFVEKY